MFEIFCVVNPEIKDKKEIKKTIKQKRKGVGGDKNSSEMLIMNGGEMPRGNLHAMLVICLEEFV